MDSAGDLLEAIDEIVSFSKVQRHSWQDGGWAPRRAGILLSKSRLDRQVELSQTLRIWVGGEETEESEGRLILAWANLGALVEGTMKWFLCVWAHSYDEDPVSAKRGWKTGEPLDPDKLSFFELSSYLADHIWADWDKKGRVAWCDKIRNRRNVIHAYNDRDIGSWVEWYESVEQYLEFVRSLDARVPDPPPRD